MSITLLSCNATDSAITPEEVAGPAVGSSVYIRIRNSTNLDFDSVLVEFPHQSEQYGAIAVGELSDYRRIGGAYRYAYVEARNGDRLYVLQPIDFVGESLLDAGYYTYNLRGNFSGERFAGAPENIHGYLGVTLEVDSRGN